MRLAPGQLGPIKEEEKHRSEEYAEQAKEFSLSLMDWNGYRISEFSLDKTKAYLDEEIRVTGKFQINYWWEVWAGWKPYTIGGVFLLVDGEPRYYTKQIADDGSFRLAYTPKVVGSHTVKAVAHKAPTRAAAGTLSVENKWDRLQQWVVAKSVSVPVKIVKRSTPKGGEGGWEERKAPTFWQALKSLDTDALWKHHKAKTMALAIGGTVFLLELGGD